MSVGARAPLRALLAALAIGAAVPGTWALLAPRSFYDDFPGPGHWVARLPSYNPHLVTDVGAFYLAFALLFAWAAWRPARELVAPLTVAWAAFSAVHLGWHAAHLDGFSTADAVGQTVSLAAVLAATLAALALASGRATRSARGASRPRRRPRDPRRRASRRASSGGS
jgi:hypothetical protein